MPERLQLSRKSGARLPEGARSVARTGARRESSPMDWGNPFGVGWLYAEPESGRVPPLPDVEGYAEGELWSRLIGGEPWVYEVRTVVSRAHAVALFIAWTEQIRNEEGLSYRDMARRDLAGLSLACWCPLPAQGEPDICHAAALLAMAAGRRTRTPVVEFGDGKSRVKVQRMCNGCGSDVGDVTEAEIVRSIAGMRLPDVRKECEHCAPTLGPPQTWRDKRLAMAGISESVAAIREALNET